jgi:hypothetical protein
MSKIGREDIERGLGDLRHRRNRRRTATELRASDEKSERLGGAICSGEKGGKERRPGGFIGSARGQNGKN